MLERALKQKQLKVHGDSVFAFKHLGVMKAARPETREQGKYYMVQLLNLEPSVKILDMYASDMIYMIFKNLKEEFEENRMKLQRTEALAAANRQSPPTSSSHSAPAIQALASKTAADSPQPGQSKPAVPKRSSLRPWFWIGGASAALIGAGITAYLFERKPDPDRVTYVVD